MTNDGNNNFKNTTQEEKNTILINSLLRKDAVNPQQALEAIESGADIFCSNQMGTTAIEFALFSECEKAFHMLIDRISKATKVPRLTEESYNNIEWLLGQRAQKETNETINSRKSDEDKKKSLKLIEDNKQKILNLLESFIITPNIGQELIDASKSGNIDQVRDLLGNKEIDINVVNFQTHDNPIIVASENGHTEIVSLLISNGVNVNHQTKLSHLTPLMLASIRGHTEVVRKLLDAGADVGLIAKKGSSAIDIALQNQKFDIVELLVSKIFVQDPSSQLPYTALLKVCHNNKLEEAKKMLTILLKTSGNIDNNIIQHYLSSHEQENESIDLLIKTQFINKLINNPASFDEIVGDTKFVKYITDQNIPELVNICKEQLETTPNITNIQELIHRIQETSKNAEKSDTMIKFQAKLASCVCNAIQHDHELYNEAMNLIGRCFINNKSQSQISDFNKIGDSLLSNTMGQVVDSISQDINFKKYNDCHDQVNTLLSRVICKKAFLPITEQTLRMLNDAKIMHSLFTQKPQEFNDQASDNSTKRKLDDVENIEEGAPRKIGKILDLDNDGDANNLDNNIDIIGDANNIWDV